MTLLTSSRLQSAMPEVEIGIVAMLEMLRRMEYNGSKGCGDYFAKIELALDDYEYFTNKYIVPGTRSITSVSASVTIDFSSFDINTLADGMHIIVVTNVDLDGDGNEEEIILADIYGDYYSETGVSPLLADIATAINGGTTGWAASSDATSITISCPSNLGALPNSAVVNIVFQPYYQFTKACLALSGASVGSPGWTGIGFDETSGYVYAANEGGDKKLYAWNGLTGTPTSPSAPTSSIAQIGGTTINKGLVFRPISPKKIIVGSTNFSPPASNLYLSTPTPTADVFITPAIGTKQLEARLYGTQDDYIYFGGVGVGIRAINPDNPTGPIFEYATGNYSGIYIYNPRPWVMDPFTQNVWCTGEWSNAGLLTDYGFVIVTTGVSPSYNVITTGTAPSGRKPIAMTYIADVELFVVVMRNTDEICFYDYTGTLLSSKPLNSTASNIESIVYDSINERIIIGKSDTSVEVYTKDGTFDTTFDVPTDIAGTASHFAFSQTGATYVAITDTSGQNLYLAKIEMVLIGDAYTGVFTGGVTEIVWDESANCITDSQANSQLEELLSYLGIGSCAENIVTDQDPLTGIFNGYKFLGTTQNSYIQTGTGAYIRLT